MSFPGVGAAFGTFGPLGGPVGPPALFAILPVARKVALEPGLDAHRIQTQGTTVFAGNLALRVNYAVSGGWYGALGGNLEYFKATGLDAETVTGMNLGWGYRFPLTGGLGGRAELNYAMMRDNANLALPPINTFSLLVGVTLPVR